MEDAIFPMRLNKYLAWKKLASRREADRLISDKKVLINDRVAVLGDKVSEKDVVKIRERKGREELPKLTVALNKPRGLISAINEKGGETIFDYLPQYKHLNAVGRLDKDSEGLILLSNDGVLTATITSEKHIIEKEYEVVVWEKIQPLSLKRMSEGVSLDGQMTLPAVVEKLGDTSFSIILKEGRKHQIRRMADEVHLTIKNLKRVRIGSITLKEIGKPGEYRELRQEEVDKLKQV